MFSSSDTDWWFLPGKNMQQPLNNKSWVSMLLQGYKTDPGGRGSTRQDQAGLQDVLQHRQPTFCGTQQSPMAQKPSGYLCETLRERASCAPWTLLCWRIMLCGMKQKAKGLKSVTNKSGSKTRQKAAHPKAAGLGDCWPSTARRSDGRPEPLPRTV